MYLYLNNVAVTISDVAHVHVPVHHTYTCIYFWLLFIIFYMYRYGICQYKVGTIYYATIVAYMIVM